MGSICFKTNYLCYEITETGQSIRFSNDLDGKNYAVSCPCAVIVGNDYVEIPASGAQFSNDVLTITFADGTIADVLVKEHDTYITFTLKNVTRQDFLAIAFVNINLDEREKEFCGSLIGMTLSTRMKEHPGDNCVLRAEAYPHIGLYSTTRSPYPAKAAIIGAPKSMLRGIQRQVLDEIPDGELPKSQKGGPYADLAAEEAKGNYTFFMSPVTLETIDGIVAEMKRFSLNQIIIHNLGHFSQGDFQCNKELFPNGLPDIKKVVDRLHEEGFLVGIQPYAFFTAPQSRYVTPVPHPDLDTLREFTLGESIQEQTLTVKVLESTEGMSAKEGYVMVNSPYLWIDDELIRFKQVEEGVFSVCERGAYGTRPAQHDKGARVRQLKQYFYLPLAKAGSELFYEIARNTAEFYNACGADMFYLDALDGAAILEGEDYVWYHAMDFIKEMFRYLDKDPVFECCYNSQYTGSWFVRSRYGSIDQSLHAHRQCFDAHVKYNAETAERMGVTPELGWVSFFPQRTRRGKVWQNEPIFSEDVEYLCAKALGTDASLALIEDFYLYKDFPCAETFARIMTKYDEYRKNNEISVKAKKYLCQPNNASYLEDGILRQAQYPTGNIERTGDCFEIKNPFSEQIPLVRVEARFAAEDYDSPQAVTLCELHENIPVTNQSFRMETPVDSCGNRGLGVWCHGDGSGAIVCIKLRNLGDNRQKSGEHFIRVNFVGWRYFAFYEDQNGTMPTEEWPRIDIKYETYNELQNFYGHYRTTLDYDAIDGVDICMKGEGQVFLRDIRLVPHRSPVWEKPTLHIGESSITFDTNLQAGQVLYYDGKSCVVTDDIGNVLDKPQCLGEPVCPSGNVHIGMTHSGDDKFVRAKVTVTLRGESL